MDPILQNYIKFEQKFKQRKIKVKIRNCTKTQENNSKKAKLRKLHKKGAEAAKLPKNVAKNEKLCKNRRITE